IELILPEPIVGEKPCALDDVKVVFGDVYATRVEWRGELDKEGRFKHGEKYYVDVLVYPNVEGVKIEGDYDRIDVRINGNASTISFGGYDDSYASIYHAFLAVETGKIPENASASAFEWEVLRLVNIERAREGLEALTLLPALQELCDIRAREITQKFSHTRPNGTDWLTVYNGSDANSLAEKAENIAEGATTPEQVVKGWMNSPGHRANIMNPSLRYLGVGHFKRFEGGITWRDYWVQLFASRDSDIEKLTYSTSERNFTLMEDAPIAGYITVYDKDGYTSYMPIDFESMVKVGKGYSPNLKTSNLEVFTYSRTTEQLIKDIEAKWQSELKNLKVTNDYTKDNALRFLDIAFTVEPKAFPTVILTKFKLIPAETTREGYIALTVTVEKHREKQSFLLQKQFDRLPREIDVDSTQGSLFDRYIPVAQVYSAELGNFSNKDIGSAVHFDLGTRYANEINPSMVNPNFKRADYQGHFLKVSYLGTYGTVGKEIAFDRLGFTTEADYNAILNGQKGTAQYPKLTKDTIIVSVDLYDADKNFVRTVSPASVIAVSNNDGEFITFSLFMGRYASLYFSLQDNIFKADEDAKTGKKRTYITASDLFTSDKALVESLLTINEDNIDTFDAYKFTQYPELEGAKRYDTNTFIDDDEFITPDGTYYQVGLADNGIDPVVKNKVENVVFRSAYPRILATGYTQQLLITDDGTMYGVTNKYEFSTVALNVKKATRDYYLTNDGILYEFSGKIAATDVIDFDESYDRTVYGVLKSDDTFYLGYTYIAGGDGYAAGLQKMCDNGAMVVAGGVYQKDHTFWRWESTLVSAQWDEHAFASGQFIQTYVHKLSIVKVCGEVVRIFPHELLSKVSDNDINNNDMINGFVVDKSGTLYGYGLHIARNFGTIGIVENIFPMFSSNDYGNFVGIKVEGDPNPYAITARYCNYNKYMIGRVCYQRTNNGKIEMYYPSYMCEVGCGFRDTEGVVNVYDNDKSCTSDRTFEPLLVSNFGQMQRKLGIFCAYNFEQDVSLPLLPSVASWNYDNKRICLIERTDGSMWMAAIHPRNSAPIVVAKLGGYENSNAVQITSATTATAKPRYTLPVFVAHTDVRLTLGSLTAYVNGKAVTLDAPPINRND
ncbi:MAG: hypothetical protein IKY12_05545, partial [Clostridia bacterium]|nr:hypothetical protein [Clostridia bacterium]